MTQAGLTFDPPAALDAASVSTTDAIARIPAGLLPNPKAAVPKLAIWSQGSRLVWMIIRADVPGYAAPSGAALPNETPEEKAARSAPQDADIVGVVDARTGEYLGVFVLGSS